MTNPHPEQLAALDAIVDACMAKLGPLLAKVDLTDAGALTKLVQQVCPELVAAYGNAAASLAAEWYTDERDTAKVPGDFTPILAEPPQPARWESMATWLTHPDAGTIAREKLGPDTIRIKPDPASLVKGGVDRSVRQMHRETIAQAAVADPASKGWARFGSGDDCGFCLMLIDRGAVYTSASARFASHDHCRCSAGPVWEGERGAQQVAAYRASAIRAGKSDATRKADDRRARAWIRANA